MTAWWHLAACAGDDSDAWFSEDQRRQDEARAVCAGCPVRDACLADARDSGERWGVRGGEWFGPELEDPMLVAEPTAFLRVTVRAHGHRATYTGGCRCDLCNEANTAYKANYDKNGPVTRRPKVVEQTVPMFEGVA